MRRGQFLRSRLFEFQGVFHPAGVPRVDALAPPMAVPLLEHQLIFLLSDFAVVVRSVDGESQPHPQSRDRNDNILWISRFALPALEENEVLAGGFPKSQRMSCFMFDSTIDTDGDRSIVLKHRKADFGYASVSFVAKRFDQL